MAEKRLEGVRVAFLVTNGFEDSELTSPWAAVEEAGGQPALVSPQTGTITGKNGHQATVDLPVDWARASFYDALVLPGGRINSDQLRRDAWAIGFVRDFFATSKPVAAICHGAWILADAGVVRGRTMTSYQDIEEDLRAAGANWVDREVVVDDGLVTSRRPADLPAFNAALVEEFCSE